MIPYDMATHTVKQKINLLSDWYTQPLGRCFLPIERRYIDKFLPSLFGYHLVQVGGAVDYPLTTGSPVRHQLHVSPLRCRHFPGDFVYSDGDELPLRPHSVDVVFMPHHLELLSHPGDCLADVAESLVLGGHLVLTGFNRWSLLRQSARWQSAQPLWSVIEWHSMQQIRNWLRPLGFTVSTQVTYFFRPAMRQRQSLKKLLLMDTVGQFMCPYWGGGYLIVAKKQAHVPMGIRRTAAQHKRFLVGGMVGSSNFDQGVS